MIMKKMKPLEYTSDKKRIGEFKDRMEELGFTLQPIGKPETYTFETSKDDMDIDLLSDLSVTDREVIDGVLKEKEADGALIFDLDCKGETEDSYGSLYVTLLMYKLTPKED
jgi:hypothetical protein